MIAETVFVGTEILLGHFTNTNSLYLADKFAEMGIATHYQSVVGDSKERIMEMVKLAMSRSELIIFSGGMGPTQDDITKESVAEALGLDLVLDERTKKRIITYFQKRGRVLTDNNFKQAMIPEGATVIDNDNGTAPGVFIEKDDKKIVLLPGPQEELIPMFEKTVVPLLRKYSNKMIYSSVVKVCGYSESEVADSLDDLITNEGDVIVAPYAKNNCEVHIRITATADDEKSGKKIVKPIINEIKGRLGDYVYTTNADISLEQAVVDLLLANKLTVTTVESCTGGLVAARLINVPGVSEVFKSGQITYSNNSKHRILGVKKHTLEKYGAVSTETVREMAIGASFFNHADVAVAVSGIAGPDGGTPEKPVGLVYIGCAVCGDVITKELHLSGNREKIRQTAVSESLILMRRCILKYYSKVTFGKDEA